MKSLAVESSEAESRFQQLEKLHLLYEEYTKICKESIPIAEKNLIELKEELEEKTQALDDVILDYNSSYGNLSHICRGV